MNWETFKRAVEAAGLQPRDCGNHHWQIKGGEQLVNCWAHTNRGFRIAAKNGNGRSGTMAWAITLAGPPKVPEPQAEQKYPASVPKTPPWEQRVGLIRRFWRWIW